MHIKPGQFTEEKLDAVLKIIKNRNTAGVNGKDREVWSVKKKWYFSNNAT